MKHFSLDARKREDRQIDDRDDQDAEEHRRADLLTRGKHCVQPFLSVKSAPELILFQTELPHDIFHDDHRAVDDESEIDRAQAHQISGNAEARHPGDGEEKSERDRRRDDERSAPVAEEK